MVSSIDGMKTQVFRSREIKERIESTKGNGETVEKNDIKFKSKRYVGRNSEQIYTKIVAVKIMLIPMHSKKLMLLLYCY